MDFQQEFVLQFKDRFANLTLKNVVVKKSENLVLVTFLYPSTDKELTNEEKSEITNWIQEKLSLEKLTLKVKFMRVFLEEKLILKDILNFFEEKYKLISTYLTKESFQIKITPIDVQIDVELSSRMFEFFVEHKISAELAKLLKGDFLVDFIVELKENSDIVDEVDIQNVEMKTTYKVTKRYDVEIVKDVVGKGINPKPEYLSYIKSPKKAVIVAGFINKFERREFVIKKGKRAGNTKAYYTFVLQDGRGKMDCIYFSSKANERVMNVLEDCDYLLLHGDVRLNQAGKLCLYVDKIALANMVEKKEEVREKLPEQTGSVVKIEKLSAMEQDTMFEHKDLYNAKIMGRTIVVFDIETTGLNFEEDQIIELGAVKIENGNIIEKFSTFVKPTKRISFDITHLTGITNEMVEDAPPVEYVIKDFYEFTRGCVLCGHNVIGFDIKFIKREGENLGLNFDNELIDTINEARVSRLKISKFNLATVLKALGLTNEGAHRAWNDAFATAQVLLKLNKVN